jgi:site-specific DNA-methyltransferase (adenine-specific)
MIELDTVHHSDIFDLCAKINDASVDLILCDLPYGVTGCAWDAVIPFAQMWEAFNRIITPAGAIVLTASQPFSSVLIASNLPMFRYRWTWDKGQGSDFQLAKLRPLTVTEDICVFSHARTANGAKKNMAYYPQMGKHDKPVKSGGAPKAKYLNDHSMKALKRVSSDAYPTNLIRFSKEGGKNREHPTQKPVALFEYLIKTYTLEGETVFDPCCGSGTTAIAARNTARRFVVGDSNAGYIEITHRRLNEPAEPPKPAKPKKRKVNAPLPGQLPLFADGW